jgi:hypothetical protein
LAILASLVCFAATPVAFAPPPWADDDPLRAELANGRNDGVRADAAGKKKEKQIPKSQFHWRGAEETYTRPEGHRLA